RSVRRSRTRTWASLGAECHHWIHACRAFNGHDAGDEGCGDQRDGDSTRRFEIESADTEQQGRKAFRERRLKSKAAAETSQGNKENLPKNHPTHGIRRRTERQSQTDFARAPLN